jgi:hypothetical protein
VWRCSRPDRTHPPRCACRPHHTPACQIQHLGPPYHARCKTVLFYCRILHRRFVARCVAASSGGGGGTHTVSALAHLLGSFRWLFRCPLTCSCVVGHQQDLVNSGLRVRLSIAGVITHLCCLAVLVAQHQRRMRVAHFPSGPAVQKVPSLLRLIFELLLVWLGW